jgi:sarcosine oxidase
VAAPRNTPSAQVHVVVIGGGIVGAAAALAARRRGARVALVERSPLARADGSSKGTARIFAPAAYPDQSYLELGLRALEQWREIEAAANERLLWETGALSVGEFAAHQLPALRAANVNIEMLSSSEASKRLGVSVSDDRPLLHQPDAGVIAADRALVALLRLGREAGVDVHGDEPVTSIRQERDGVVVETSRRRLRSAAAIVAAGTWSPGLLAGTGIEPDLRITRQTVAYFSLADPRATPVAVIDYDGDEPYALWDPAGQLKAAFHARGPDADPDDPAPDVERLATGRLAAWVAERFPGLTKGLLSTESCLYANTSDERFVIERRERIVVVSACNGHGFQFAPASGARAARLALEPAEVAIR